MWFVSCLCSSLKRFGFVNDRSRSNGAPGEGLRGTSEHRLLEVLSQQHQPCALTLSALPSTRKHGGQADTPWRGRTPALRRLSCQRVCQFVEPSLHDLPSGQSVRNTQTLSIAQELQHEVRSLISHPWTKSQLFNMSPAKSRWGGDDDSSGIQRPYHLLSVPRSKSPG